MIINGVTPELIAFNSNTGAFCAGFGINGRADLCTGMGKRADKGQY